MSAIGSEDRAQILVAEDNESNSILALRQLERLGYRAVVVHDGHEAVAAVSTGRFALVLMDCHMSGMDGFAAARAIRAQEQPGSPRVPIVAVTASATQRDREECDAAGMDDFISKPVTLQDLAGVLGRWLGLDATGIASVPAPMGTGSGAVDEVTLRALRADLEEPAFSRFVRAYLDELPGRTIAIRRAVEAGDPAGLRFAAHSLKSSSAAVGAARLASLCAELEEIGGTGSTSGASERADELETERVRVAEVLAFEGER